MLKPLSSIFSENFKTDFKKSFQNHWKRGDSKKKYGNKGQVESSFDFLSLIRSWGKIVGEKSAENTIPLKIQNKTLYVLTNHSAYSEQLSFLESPIKEKIFCQFPNLRALVKRIQFRVNSTVFNQKFAEKTEVLKKRKSNELHPYSPEYRKLSQMAEEVIGEIEDQEIKDSIKSIFIQKHHK